MKCTASGETCILGSSEVLLRGPMSQSSIQEEFQKPNTSICSCLGRSGCVASYSQLQRMQTFSKRRNYSNKDSISNLPSELLCKILSFLESREAVRTCILSSKWRYIWTSVPAIHLDLLSFVQLGPDCGSVFEKFCNNLLLRRESVDLDTFRLSLWYRHSLAFARTWIIDAFKCNPRVVDIGLGGNRDMHLPDCIFICGTLEKLRVDCKIHAPKFVNLPHLRVLEIHWTTFSDDFMSKLNSRCPVLEDLTLKHCDLCTCEISSGTLRKLTLESCYRINKMRISLPTLVYLYIGWCSLGELGLINLSSLVTATIKHCGSSALMKFLGGLSNVKHLSLYGSRVKDMLETRLQEGPIFDNLKSLSLSICKCRRKDIHILVSFLKLLPNLENLVLENVGSLKPNFQKRARTMAFCCKHLKDVRIKCRKNDGSNQLVRALLMNAENSMKINVSVSQELK